MNRIVRLIVLASLLAFLFPTEVVDASCPYQQWYTCPGIAPPPYGHCQDWYSDCEAGCNTEYPCCVWDWYDCGPYGLKYCTRGCDCCA